MIRKNFSKGFLKIFSRIRDSKKYEEIQPIKTADFNIPLSK